MPPTHESAILEATIARIRDRMHPDRIVLFGSRAAGTADPGSDYDLLVIAEADGPRFRRSAPLYRLVSDLPAEFDIVVYTPGEVAEWSAVPEAFVTRAIRNGRVLYERAA
jgi:predicted nucleotidyltransferase